MHTNYRIHKILNIDGVWCIRFHIIYHFFLLLGIEALVFVIAVIVPAMWARIHTFTIFARSIIISSLRWSRKVTTAIIAAIGLWICRIVNAVNSSHNCSKRYSYRQDQHRNNNNFSISNNTIQLIWLLMKLTALERFHILKRGLKCRIKTSKVTKAIVTSAVQQNKEIESLNQPLEQKKIIAKIQSPKIKKIHLSLDEAKLKKEKLQMQVKSESIKQNKTKKKRLFEQLAKLNKAINNPELYLVDPKLKESKQIEDRQRRVEKKLTKSKAKKKEIKKQQRYKKRCLRCNSKDHLISQCKEVESGFCYKCGSKDHSHKNCQKDEYSFAVCFICQEKGHISRDCAQNDKGLYRKGGSCFGCGSVRHTLKDCPERHSKKYSKNDENF